VSTRPPRVLVASFLACAPPLPPPPVDLVDHAAWAPTPADQDPWPDHRPAEVQCGALGAYVEDGTFEIDTAACNHLAVSQTTLWALPAGTRLQLAATHAALFAPEPATAHIALSLDDEVLWDEQIPIPSDANPYTLELKTTEPHEADAVWFLHLHNHGGNTWRLLHVRTR
jgi:hypothetical protein